MRAESKKIGGEAMNLERQKPDFIDTGEPDNGEVEEEDDENERDEADEEDMEEA